MSTKMLGTRIPRVVPMTDEQYRIHRRQARAEQRLIVLISWDADPEKIAAAQQTVNKWTSAWKTACARAALSQTETVNR